MVITMNILDLSCNSFNLLSKEIQVLFRKYENDGDTPLTLKDNLYSYIKLPKSYCYLSYYSSSWGQELTKEKVHLVDSFSFYNTKGRSNGESAPFFTLSTGQTETEWNCSSTDISYIDFAIKTSSNYRVELIPDEENLHIYIKDIDPEFETTLQSHSAFSFPIVLAHCYNDKKAGHLFKQNYAREQQKQSGLSTTLPVVYNHWWAYEDKHINEEVLIQNAQIAATLGADILVLDAGWFGNNSLTEEWYAVRGDWTKVNKCRFPNGLAGLRKKVENLGLKLGIWCELEGIGRNSSFAEKHPEYLAKRDNEDLGYLCFSHPEVQEWAFNIMAFLFKECSAYYWKLDFNLDPGIGCNCMSHYHGARDGLHFHYEGLYKVLDKLHNTYPQLIIENCSSGGQRFNLEMAGHCHLHFMSDPDYSTHQMRLFKECSKWFLPNQLLHFMWSNTVSTNGQAPFPKLDLNLLSPGEIKYHIRLAMLHTFGISHPLLDYDDDIISLLKEEICLYKQLIRTYIKEGQFLPLHMEKDINIFSYELEHSYLIFHFAKIPALLNYNLPFIDDSANYQISYLDCAETYQYNGLDIKNRCFKTSADWESSLILITAVT